MRRRNEADEPGLWRAGRRTWRLSNDLTPGRLVGLAPGVARLVAPNPGMMTGPGTNTYILGSRELAIVDPGPALAAHLAALRQAVTAPVRWLFVTHTHPDHSPAAAVLAADCAATLIGRPAPANGPQDRTFQPDRVPCDGEVFEAADFSLQAVPTPGHASNHVCYLHAPTGWLFTGDHIINGSTVVVDPPDGNMSDYLDSLVRLQRLQCTALAPGHGALIRDPLAAIDGLVRHRLAREAKVGGAVSAHPGATLGELVKVVYDDVDTGRHPVAERSLLAHLQKLERDSRIACRGDRWHPRC